MRKWWERAPEKWHSGELLLACGATAVADLRAAVAAELNYSCSAGIAHNKACFAAFCLLPMCVYAVMPCYVPHALLRYVQYSEEAWAGTEWQARQGGKQHVCAAMYRVMVVHW